MAIGDNVKIDRAWKLALDRALTAVQKEFYEEQYSTGRVVHSDDVWKETIDSDPAQAVNDGVAQLYQELVLEEDLSVAGKKAWVAKSGGVRLQDWISPRFGQGYTVQLFDQNGNPVNIAAKGITYRVPAVTDLSGDIDTADAASLGLVSGNSFIMTLHIDTNVCSASTDAPTLGGVAANDCGVLEYDSGAPGSVTMDYAASHPHGFANYRFRLFRGVTLLTPPSTGVTPVGAGSFSTTTPVSTLLGSCPVAGFSENLHVWASATNGWRRLQEYDAHAVRAFVLAPEEEDE